MTERGTAMDGRAAGTQNPIDFKARSGVSDSSNTGKGLVICQTGNIDAIPVTRGENDIYFLDFTSCLTSTPADVKQSNSVELLAAMAGEPVQSS
ncbi:hypothetical protein BaRGS_00018932 [Batillaria attramentaria]|uniref:Uncharacterized protein n=1 Tax=Batillaria attramentaria TaxID=370345 RepID=A0ABD0KSW9_9CAEN